MALDDHDPAISEAELGTALAERGLDCSSADRQGVLAAVRFLRQAALRIRLYESAAHPAALNEPRESEADEAGA
jgi:hypothetical protein